jgi:hypothetical protein
MYNQANGIAKVFWGILFVLVVSVSLQGVSFALDEREDCMEQVLDTYVRFMPAASAKASSGKVELIKAESEYSCEVKAFGKLPVKFSVGTEYIGIDDTLSTLELPAHLNGLSTDIETTFPFFKYENMYMRVGVSPSFYADDWDFPSSSFRIPSRYFLIYRPNDMWTFIGGVAVFPDFEDEVLPIAGFIYRPNDKLTFNLVPKRPAITYMLNDRVSLFTEGSMALNSEFEVSRDNRKNEVLRYKESRLGAGVTYQPKSFIATSLSVGGVFDRSLRYKHDEGKVSLKNGMYTEARVVIRY